VSLSGWRKTEAGTLFDLILVDHIEMPSPNQTGLVKAAKRTES
jgi:hypothetical protein